MVVLDVIINTEFTLGLFSIHGKVLVFARSTSGFQVKMEQDSQPGGWNSQQQQCRMGCGFFANHSLDGMCSKCHKENVQHDEVISATQASTHSTNEPSATKTKEKQKTDQDAIASTAGNSLDNIAASPPRKPDSLKLEDTASSHPTPIETDDASSSTPKKRNRCFSCRKRVGLTGCKCRCGEIFCGLHRYSDKHNCTFDYKSDGRKRLADENPLIIGEKIKKI